VGELAALATSEQLLRVFDVDLWVAEAPGDEERFDAVRFGRWVEILHEAGPGVAAAKIAGMDFDFVTAALAEHLAVLDGTWFRLDASGDEPEVVAGEPPNEGLFARLMELIEGGHSHEIGGYQVLARRVVSSEAILNLLVDLDAAHPGFFARVMERLARVTTESLDDECFEFLPGEGETVQGDVAAGREERREAEGFVSPVMAAAFLSSARGLRFETAPLPPARDPVTAAWFRRNERRAEAHGATAPTALPARYPGRCSATTPLLGSGERGRDPIVRLREHMRMCRERDPAAHVQRMAELGYVGNVLVAGASCRGQRLRAPEAARAAAATCNLGLESWPRSWRPADRPELPPDFLVGHDLVTVFRVGWSTLHERVVLRTARKLVDILSRLTSEDGALHGHLAELRSALAQQVEAGTPWRELDNLDVLLALDPPSWSALVGLLDQCPVVPSEDQPGFEFFAESRQVQWVSEFLESLPERLSDHGRTVPAAAPGAKATSK